MTVFFAAFSYFFVINFIHPRWFSILLHETSNTSIFLLGGYVRYLTQILLTMLLYHQLHLPPITLTIYSCIHTYTILFTFSYAQPFFIKTLTKLFKSCLFFYTLYLPPTLNYSVSLIKKTSIATHSPLTIHCTFNHLFVDCFVMTPTKFLRLLLPFYPLYFSPTLNRHFSGLLLQPLCHAHLSFISYTQLL